MRDLFNTHTHAFWHERLRKETAVRVAWQLNYGQRTWKAGPLQRKQLQQVPLRAAPAADARPSTPAPQSEEARVEGPGTEETPERGSRGEEAPPQAAPAPETAAEQPGRASPPDGLEMRKAPARALQLLYQGVSRNGEGRAAYLRERYRQKPEEKFRYPVLSSWQYGWHVGKAAILWPAVPELWQAGPPRPAQPGPSPPPPPPPPPPPATCVCTSIPILQKLLPPAHLSIPPGAPAPGKRCRQI